MPGPLGDAAGTEVGRSPADGPAIEVDQLTVHYGRRVAVDGLSLQAQFGQVTCILGPNGAGKTTTLEVMEGYRRPTAGRARVLGLDPIDDRRRLSLLTGLMLQEGGIYRSMGPRHALELFASYYPSPRRPGELLDLVGLGPVARTPWRRLSGGERQRLSLALALVGRPQVVFLDEPTAGVDPEGRQVVRQVISDLRAEGACVVLTTHELEEADRLADWLYVLYRGQVLTSGTLADLADQAGPAEVKWQTAPGLSTSALAEALGAPVREVTAGEYVAQVPGTPEAVAAIAGWLGAQGLPLQGLQAGRPRLEETYLRLVTEAGGPAPAELGAPPP